MIPASSRAGSPPEKTRSGRGRIVLYSFMVVLIGVALAVRWWSLPPEWNPAPPSVPEMSETELAAKALEQGLQAYRHCQGRRPMAVAWSWRCGSMKKRVAPCAKAPVRREKKKK